MRHKLGRSLPKFIGCRPSTIASNAAMLQFLLVLKMPKVSSIPCFLLFKHLLHFLKCLSATMQKGLHCTFMINRVSTFFLLKAATAFFSYLPFLLLLHVQLSDLHTVVMPSMPPDCGQLLVTNTHILIRS